MSVGQVDIIIYYGTKFDDLNIPLYTDLIRDTATKKKELKANFVWQTTWLANITLNVLDYQDIVGAQYIEIIDIGTANHGAHWFTVGGYKQISRKTASISLIYDALLSIGISHITKISGVMKRWTVSDDAHFNYVNSSEPINQIDDYNFSYYRYDTIDHNSPNEPIVAFPYDMEKKPSILSYTNQDGVNTNILYPQLELSVAGLQTGFRSSISYDSSNTFIQDGMTYYYWRPNTSVNKNYGFAIGLGYDLASLCYILPRSNLITRNVNGERLIEIVGTKITINTGFGLYFGGYNNAKAGEIGLYYTLYNEITGDSTTIENKDLMNVSITIMVNPYPSGFFAARFSGYYNDINGISGIVKSVGYRQFPISSTMASGQSINTLNNVMNTDNMLLQYKNQEKTANVQYDNAQNSNMYSAFSNSLGALGNIISGNFGGAVNNITGLGNNIINDEINTNNYNNTIDIINSNRNQQKRELSVQGTLGQIMPPAFKMANAESIDNSAYTFVVRQCTLSERDRLRADRFFTAYGYNVDSTLLNNVQQLQNRTRFTFIMADDVNVIEVSGNTDLTRLRDFQTINQIRVRFSAGLRIWKVEPDYDFSKSNPII